MKTHVLIVSKTFPGFHPKKGQHTNFPESIASGKKIHTIRNNYSYWEGRVQDVLSGHAKLSVRCWTGKPYKSKQETLFEFTREDGMGIESIIIKEKATIISPNPFLHVMRGVSNSIIAENDGLSLQDFEDWFGLGDYREGARMAIIHFTNFRYVR